MTHQDTEEDHTCQHHHCGHTLHYTRSRSKLVLHCFLLGTKSGYSMLNASMLHNLPQGLIQDAEEDHACQHHHCCHTLHHISWSQRTDYNAACVAHSFPSDPSGYRGRPCLPATSVLLHIASCQHKSAFRLHSCPCGTGSVWSVLL